MYEAIEAKGWFEAPCPTHFAGTSTGACIATWLACGKTAGDLLDFYRQHGPAIFGPRSLFDRLNPFDEWFSRANYGSEALRDALYEVFGNQRLGDIVKPLYIGVTDLDGPRGVDAILMSNRNEYRDTRIVDALLASCAAPTFFPSKGNYVDGGLALNNPAGAVAAELRETTDNLVIHDFGTGDYRRHDYMHSRTKDLDWSAVKWLRKGILDTMMEASANAATDVGKALADEYYQYNFELDREIGLDEVKAYSELVKAGRFAWGEIR